MTTQEKLIRSKMNLVELGEYLQNGSEACRVMGVRRQHFYDIKRAFEEGGAAALREKSRQKPNPKNRTAPEVEQAILELALEQPAHGQVRVANELKRRGTFISAAGVRSVWLRHELETLEKRLESDDQRPIRIPGPLPQRGMLPGSGPGDAGAICEFGTIRRDGGSP